MSSALSTSPQSAARSVASSARPPVILDYWYGTAPTPLQKSYLDESKLKVWFSGGAEVDKYIIENFKADVEQMASGEYDSWIESSDPLDGLAGVILMDQFTRNIYRGSAQAFSLDPKALEWAKHLLDSGKADPLPHIMRVSLLLPLMHSEDLADQQRCVEMYEAEAAAATAALGADSPLAGRLKGFVQFAIMHKQVVEQWGRFPHRNAVLGRESTEEEARGLAEGTIKKF